VKRLEFLGGGTSAFIGFDDRFVISALGRSATLTAASQLFCTELRLPGAPWDGSPPKAAMAGTNTPFKKRSVTGCGNLTLTRVAVAEPVETQGNGWGLVKKA